jgi:hypothetical protein
MDVEVNTEVSRSLLILVHIMYLLFFLLLLARRSHQVLCLGFERGLKPLPNEFRVIIIKINLTTNYQLLLNCNKVHRADITNWVAGNPVKGRLRTNIQCSLHYIHSTSYYIKLSVKLLRSYSLFSNWWSRLKRSAPFNPISHALMPFLPSSHSRLLVTSRSFLSNRVNSGHVAHTTAPAMQ